MKEKTKLSKKMDAPADQKIVNLDPIVSQNTTDLYETSANGTGSFKETRAQMLAYMSAHVQIAESQVTNLTSDLSSKLAQSNNLSDVSSRSSAQSNIGLNAAPLLYSDNANHTVSNPMPEIIGVDYSVSGCIITFPPVNTGQSIAFGQEPYLVNFGSVPVQFNANDGTPIILLEPGQEVQTILQDNSTAPGTWGTPRPNLISLNGLSGQPDLTSEDGSVSINPGSVNIDLSISSALAAYFLIANNLSEIASNPTNARGNLGFATGTLTCNLAQNYIITNPAPKIIDVIIPSTGYSITLPAVGGPGQIQAGENILIYVDPSSSQVILQDANNVNIGVLIPGQNYIAVNISSIQSAPQWYLITNNEGGSQDMQSTYNNGSLVSLTEGQPIQISANQQIIGPNQLLIKNYSTAGFSISQDTVFGESFIPNTNGYIVAFAWSDARLPSGQSRQVALYQYIDVNNGTLIYQDTVYKTDPLDSTGNYRIHSITPILLTAGTRYCLAGLNLAGDFVMFYQTYQPDFGINNGNNYPGYINTSMIYPRPMNDKQASQALGGQNCVFQSITGSDSQLQIADSSISSAFEQVTSTTQGNAPFPPMTTVQWNAIASKIHGLLGYNTDTNTIDYFDGSDTRKLLNTNNIKGTGGVAVTDNLDGTVTVSGDSTPPSGPAGGDLSGSYPTPTVSQINGSPLGTISASTPGNILVAQGGHWNSQAMGGDATIGGGGALALNTVNSSPGSFGDASHSLSANVNGKGLITALSTNSIQISESQVTNLTSDLSSKLNLSGGTMSGNLILNADPTASAQAATKNYVDMVAAGLQPKEAVSAATTANLVGTYLNGTSGVGATFTMTATGVLTLDGQTVTLGNRYLLKNQTSGFQNGIYDCTVAGAVGVAAVFTRSSDYNTAGDMDAGSLIPIISGTTWGGTTWLQSATVTTVGTDSLVFSEFAGGPTILTGDVNANGFSPTSTTVVAINSNPLGSTTPTNGNILTANGTNWSSTTPAALTAANDTNVTLTLGGTPASALLKSSSITAGWTGTLAAGRLNNNVVQGITNDTNVTGSISSQNLTLGWTGQLAETRGGTHQSTYTLGDILYSSSSNTLSKLSGNTTSTTKALLQTGTGTVSAAPVWTAIPTSIAGTANQVIASASTGAVTLSLPQSIATSSSPTFYNETLTGTGVIQQTIQSTTTGSANYANLLLYRGDNPNGYNIIQLGTAGTGEWQIAEYANSGQLKIRDVVNGLDQIQINPGSGTTGSVVVAGSLSANSMNIANLSASSLIATDGSKNITSSISSLSPTMTGLTLSGLNSVGTVQTNSSGVLSTVSSTSSYTPTIGDGTHNFTTSTATGKYEQVGNIVYVWGYIIWTGKGSAAAGSPIVISLPVIVGSSSGGGAIIQLGYTSGISITGSATQAYAATSTSSINLYGIGSTGTATTVDVSGASTSGQIYFSTFYTSN